MNFSNLSTVIGPCILFSKVPSGNMQQQLAEISKVTKVVHVLIENYPNLAKIEDTNPPDSPKAERPTSPSPSKSSFKSKLSKKFSGLKHSKKIAVVSPTISKSEEKLPETKLSSSPLRITTAEIDKQIIENVVTRQRSVSK